MDRIVTSSLLLAVLPAPALADPGHIASAAGHDHWVAGAALGAAVLVAAWGWLKGKEQDEEAEAGSNDEAEA